MNLETAPQPGMVPLSTSLDPNTPSVVSGGGKPDLNQDEGGASLHDVLSSEFARLKTEEQGDKAAEEKPGAEGKKAAEKDAKQPDDKEAKADRARTEKGQFAKAEKAEGEEADEGADKEAAEAAPEKAQDGQAGKEGERQSEGRSVSEPPARLLPREREQWHNAPKVVRAGIERMVQELETESRQFKDSHERYQSIKPFDDLMRQNGRDLPERLTTFSRIEDTLARDPVAGVEMVLREAGLRFSLYDLASHVIQNGPEAYQQRAQQNQQAEERSRSSAEIDTLRRELDTLKMEQAASAIIEPFKAQHPRYHELEGDIAFVLASGKIPASLSPQDRLAEAYDMAVRLNPRTLVDDPREAPEAPETRTERRVDPAGQKSIRGAPSDGIDPVNEEAEADLETVLRKELRKMARAS